MLHGCDTWPVRKENEVAVQQAEMRKVRWMCGIKLKDRVPSKELRERLGLDDIILVLQENNLRWYGHVLQKEENYWVKKYMEYEVKAPDQEVDQRGLRERLCQKDCQARKLIREDAVDHGRWRKVTKDS